MKRFLTAMMALVVVATLNQCRKPDVESIDDVAKVRVSCTIPVNKDGKTDFINILENGTVNWSKETERIYLAIPSRRTVVELASTSEEGGATLTFTGSVDSRFLENGSVYDVWYLGRSQDSKLVQGSVTGSIATQSGDLEDLGYHHIAKATVTAIVGDGIFTLKFNNDFENQIAIVRLGDESANTSLLRGNAVIGTEYALQYDGEKFELAVTESSDAKISVTPQTEGESYVVVFPNTNNNVELISDSGKKVTFLNGVNAGSIYTVGWEEYEGNNGYEYVDLGLPSRLKWAKYNVGANTAEAYGDYFAWGEIETKDTYTMGNCSTYGVEMSGISGKAQYDAATANWESTWRMPTQWEMQELIDNCTWTWTQLNGVNGYNVTGTNGKSIFFPAAGFYDSGGGVNINEQGSYWTSTPTTTEGNQKANNLVFGVNGRGVGDNYRNCGRPVRPVCGGEYAQAEVTTAEVTDRESDRAVCGGNVTEDNGRTVTEKGVCWSTSENPTINDNKMVCGQGVGAYTVTLTGLTSATVYYVRAYAINEVGIISYGSQVRFNTTEIGNNGYEFDYSNMGSHAVDLGLPSGVLWSDCNIGAEWAVEQAVWPYNIYGNYFMWACNTSSTSFGEGYYPEYAEECNFNYSGDARYDAATNLWGGNWRTPTKKDFYELLNVENCTWEYVTKDGINCLKFTSVRNGNSIYLPFSGCYNNKGNFTDLGNIGWYLMTDYVGSEWAPVMKLTKEGYTKGITWAEYVGSSVRPVIGQIPAED